MRRLLILLLILLITVSESFAYAIKVYDEYGNRVGTYRKEGDGYQFYDFNDNKVDSPDMLIENAPDKKTLTEYSQTFYDENMIPIGTWRSGFYGNNGRYYPRYGEYYPVSWYKRQSPYIVRPRVNGINQRCRNDFYGHNHHHDNTIYVDTRYPKFHEFKK